MSSWGLVTGGHVAEGSDVVVARGLAKDELGYTPETTYSQLGMCF